MFHAAMGAPEDTDIDGHRGPTGCCPLYHEAVELVGRRWTGAILAVLMEGALRFSEIAQAVPELSDRLLSERMKELERVRKIALALPEVNERVSHGEPCFFVRDKRPLC